MPAIRKGQPATLTLVLIRSEGLPNAVVLDSRGLSGILSSKKIRETRIAQESNSLFVLGLAAGACTTLSFLPQVYRIWKRRSVADISALMHSVFSFGALLWLLYGIGLHSWPVIGANVITLALNLWILFLKWHFGRNANLRQ